MQGQFTTYIDGHGRKGISRVSFNPPHNCRKAAALLYLLAYRRGLRLRDWVKVSGLDYSSLSTAVSRWTRVCEYCYRTGSRKAGGFRYHINRKGCDWLARWFLAMPPELQELAQELDVFRYLLTRHEKVWARFHNKNSPVNHDDNYYSQ